MTIEEITKNIYREDKLMVAVKLTTGESTINDILADRRNRDTKLGKAILRAVRICAQENIKANGHKNRKLVEISNQLHNN